MGRTRRWASARTAAGLAVALAMVVVSGPAAADVRADAERLVRALAVQGTAAMAIAPVFAFQGERRARAVAPGGPESVRCRSVIGIAPRHVRFEMSWGGDVAVAGAGGGRPPDPNARASASRAAAGDAGVGRDAARVESTLGVAVLHQCGASSGPAVVEVTMRSPRAAVELVVAWHQGPLAPVGVLLPERRLTPTDGPDGSAAVGAPSPIAARLEATERQARLEGAVQVLRVAARAEPRGQGAVRLRLPAGCHRIGVLAERSQVEDAPHDVDAELLRVADRRVLATDRSVAPDARLEICLGQADEVDVRFLGAPARASVQLLDSLWPLPASLATAWDPATRATIAWGLWRRRAVLPAAGAIAEYLGAQGATFVPLSVERGGCYLAAVGHSGGQASALRLTVRAGSWLGTDTAFGALLGSAVGFCVPDDAESTSALVELRSSLAWWRLLLWRLPGASS